MAKVHHMCTVSVSKLSRQESYIATKVADNKGPTREQNNVYVHCKVNVGKACRNQRHTGGDHLKLELHKVIGPEYGLM